MTTNLIPPFGIHVVQLTDTFDDDALGKIKSAYVKHLSHNGLYATIDVFPAANSVQIGTKASELVNNTERPDCLILAGNYAPPDNKKGTTDNARNSFFCADLGGDVTLSGTSNGFEFSYLKSSIKSFYRLTNTNSLGSQFRSLQILPKHAVQFSSATQRAHLIAEGILERIEHIDDFVPSVPDVTHVLQVDNFSNVKLVLSEADRRLLDRLSGQRAGISFAFSKASIEAGGTTRRGLLGLFDNGVRRSYPAIASNKLFDAPLRTDIVAVHSSSTLTDGRSVPIIATMRDRPAETRPNFYPHLPQVGALVELAERQAIDWPAVRVRMYGLHYLP